MSSDGSFIVPPPFTTPGNYSDMPFYGIGNTVKLEWTLPEQGYESLLYLGKDGDSLSCPELNLGAIACTKLLWGNRGQSWDWFVQEPDNYNQSSPIYYPMMRDGSGSHSNLFTSHYFNLLPQDVLAASSASSASTSFSTQPSTSSRTGSATASVGGPTTKTVSTTDSVTQVNAVDVTASSAGASTLGAATSATAATSQIPAPGSDSTTKLAIGVAIGIGIPLIAALVAIAIFLHKGCKRKNARLSAQGAVRLDPSTETTPPVYFHHDPSELETESHYSSSTRNFQEMSGDSRFHPLHGPPVELYSAR